MDIEQFEARKRDHIEQALSPENQATGSGGLERVHLFHEALPDLDFAEVSLEAPLLGRPFATPFYVAAMTAGHRDAISLNWRLAAACSERGWALGLGSQRRELEDDSPLSGVDRWSEFRKTFPTLHVFANVGLGQIVGRENSQLRKLVDGVQAQALVVHANALQEVMQPEGVPQFKGAFDALRTLCKQLEAPVVLKETGCGFSAETLKRLAETGLAAIDISGLGGTHWGRIEGARAASSSIRARASRTFANWGESTVDSVLAAKVCLPNTELWASGGVRTGLDAAKLIALGAARVGYAKPALEAAIGGERELRDWMELQEFELKTALFCTGSKTPAALRTKPRGYRISEIGS